MAAGSTKLKLQQGPLDPWSIREKLALACSVMKSGDQNWVSVSRAIKPFMENNRPANWFSQRNCALQYSDLLEKVETPKRKRGDGAEVVDTPADQIFRKLMTERIEELRKIVMEEQQRYKRLKKDVEGVKSGQYDDRLSEVWEQMQAEKAAEELAKETERKALEESRAQSQQAKRVVGTKRPSVTSQSSLSEQDDTQEPFPEFLDVSRLGDEDTLPLVPTPGEQHTKTAPPPSPLLSSLLQSKLKSADGLQQLKNQAEQKEALTQQQQVQQLALQLQLSAEAAAREAAAAAAVAAAANQSRETPATAALETGTSPAQVVSRVIDPTGGTAAKSGQSSSQTVLNQVRDLFTHQQQHQQQQQQQQQKSVAQNPPHVEPVPSSPSCAAPTLSKLLFTPAQAKTGGTAPVPSSSTIPTSSTITELASPAVGTDKLDNSQLETAEQDSADETVDVTAVEVCSTEGDDVREGSCETPGEPGEVGDGKETAVEDEGTADEMTPSDYSAQPRSEHRGGGKQVSVSQLQADEDSIEVAANSFLSVDDEVSIKEEPASPASSVSSKVSETGSKVFKTRHRKGRGSRGGRRGRSSRRSVQEDDKKDDNSSKHSDADLSDDELRESDDPVPSSGLLFSESIPNSPVSMCSDTEDEKAFKTWKKSIMLVWRSAANHKYANVFLHPVTNEIAPGYKSIVHRPMDLGTIKKNIENGVLRATSEFQRDMMLMFTNAIMYNSSHQAVFKMATEMYNDVMQHIEQYVSTQLMVQSSETKVLRQSRRGELQEKEEEGKKRRTSVEQPQEGGKTKRRKTRADDT